VKGGARTPNAWFVGMVPRRNPEFAVVVLQEHGDWGRGSAIMAAQVAAAYVNKKRKQDNNLQAVKTPPKVEMGAVWSTPEQERRVHGNGNTDGGVQAGRFEIALGKEPEPIRRDGDSSRERAVNSEVAVGMPERFRGVIR